MSYTNAWNVTRPPGSEAAKNIDNEIRLLRLQIEERMTGSVVVDWTADPVVLIGTTTDKTAIIPHVAFVPAQVGGIATYHNDYVACASGIAMNAPIILPAGSTIQSIDFIVSKNDCTDIACVLYKYTFVTAAVLTVPVSISSSTAGFQTISTVALGLALDGASVYYMGISSSGGTSFFVRGANIRYS